MTTELLYAENVIVDYSHFEVSVGIAFMISAIIVMLIHFLVDRAEPKSVRLTVLILGMISIVVTFYEISANLSI